jgi:hypothetical protein
MLLCGPLLAPVLALTRGGRAALLFLLGGVAVDAGTQGHFNRYKESRQARHAALTEYVERFVPAATRRIAFEDGWLFGLRHYPVEVVSDLPEEPVELRALEKAIWFEFLVLPADTPMARWMGKREGYRLLNAADIPEGPPVLVYRRLADHGSRESANGHGS